LDDFAIALRRIAEEAAHRTGVLDLGDLQFADLPPAAIKLK
jgi:hypothetical protein